MQSTQLNISGTIEIKLINQNITPAKLLKHQLEHYTTMLKHPKLECRSLARQTLFNLKNQTND